MPNLKSLILFKDGAVIREAYFNGGHADSSHDVRSVTKSVISALVGIAMDKAMIDSENQAIGDLLGFMVETMDSSKARITLSQVLSMTTGLEGDELADASEYTQWINAPDQLTYTLNRPLVHVPGTHFAYHSGVAHLSSAIITNISGVSTYTFAGHLFSPLGIGSSGWGTDKRGIYNGGAGLRLTPLDMLKIGRLYLDRGMYGGSRVISEAWILKATTARIATLESMPFAQFYGYYWWLGRVNGHDYFFATGWGGQFIVVVPQLHLVAVATNRWSGVTSEDAQEQWYETMNLIINGMVAEYP